MFILRLVQDVTFGCRSFTVIGFGGEIHTNQLTVGRNKINVQLIISSLRLRDEVGVERCCGTDCLDYVRTVIHVLIQ